MARKKKSLSVQAIITFVATQMEDLGNCEYLGAFRILGVFVKIPL